MLNKLKRAYSYTKSVVREKIKEKTRSPLWGKTRDHFIESHPTCAACGSKKDLQVHHIKPFHLHPELELNETNLITLCMDENNCHLNIGHGDNFKAYNPNVLDDCKSFLKANQKKRKEIIVEAKKNRLFEE